MFSKNVLLAVSGGLDSICLLHYVANHREQLGVQRVVVCHVNHKIRGNEADGDEEFVKELAQKYGFAFKHKSLDGLSMLSAGDFENKARIERYKFFSEVAEQEHLDFIYTAHHADDQAETLLMRLSRGTTLKGLCGVKKKRADGIIRPFLEKTKQELLEYAQSNNLEWREDRTNTDTAYARNAVRHRLLPHLKKASPDVTEQLSRIATLAEKAYDKVLSSAEAHLTPYVLPQKLWPFPASIAPFATVIALHKQALTDLAVKSPKGASEILRLWLNTKGFSFPFKTDFSANVAERGKLQIFEKSKNILWFCHTPKTPDMHNLYLLDDSSNSSCKWRMRLNGDEYTPIFGNRSSKKLKKWFEENGVPPFARDFFPVFAKGSRVIKIYGTFPDKGLF
ncbi:MAG: tRNA lysidine(34) synthetase TilS [Fibrobacteraceae bacterium]